MTLEQLNLGSGGWVYLWIHLLQDCHQNGAPGVTFGCLCCLMTNHSPQGDPAVKQAKGICNEQWFEGFLGFVIFKQEIMGNWDVKGAKFGGL